MEQNRKTSRVEKFDIFNALPELSILIFTFLPVQSLLILRSVCKRFLSIIDDREFVEFHLHHFPSNVLQNQYLYVDSYNKHFYAALMSSSTHRELVDVIHITPGEEKTPCYLSFHGSLDGLVLLSTDMEDFFMLWNPSIRKHHWMSPPEEYVEYVSLGYDSASHDYKVLVMYMDKAYVYSVKKGSWTPLVVCKDKLTGKYNYEYHDYLSVNDGILLHMISTDPDSCTSIWFDFITETFRCTNHELVTIIEIDCGLIRLDGGSTVGMWGYDVQDMPCIWALETRTMTWSKRYKVSPEVMPGSIFTFSYFEMNGELVWKNWKDGSMQELTYDINTREIKRHIKKPWPQYCSETYYIESMIIP